MRDSTKLLVPRLGASVDSVVVPPPTCRQQNYPDIFLHTLLRTRCNSKYNSVVYIIEQPGVALFIGGSTLRQSFAICSSKNREISSASLSGDKPGKSRCPDPLPPTSKAPGPIHFLRVHPHHPERPRCRQSLSLALVPTPSRSPSSSELFASLSSRPCPNLRLVSTATEPTSCSHAFSLPLVVMPTPRASVRLYVHRHRLELPRC
jgi:hypothetical protein